MGEEVKITVIATGFRDQMPERRARMLSVEEAAVVSVPLAPISAVSTTSAPAPSASVPLVAPDQWLHEPPVEPEPAPMPARFLSQDEESEEDAFLDDEPAFFSSTASTATSVAVAPAPATAATRAEADFPPAVMESAAAPSHAQFIQPVAPEPAFPEPSLEYVPTPPASFLGLAPDQSAAHSPSSLFSQPAEEVQRDLDTPAFMRRLRF